MTLELIEEMLFRCMLLNLGLMLFSLMMVTVFRKHVEKVHGRLFNIPQQTVRVVMYSTLAGYKILAFFFIVIPWITVRFLMP